MSMLDSINWNESSPISHRLSDRDANRRLWVILGAIFFIQAGFFMMIPLLTLHFVDTLGWAATFIGVVLAIRQFTQQGLSMFGGAISDRYGPKPLILAGVSLRIISFIMLGLASTKVELLAAGILVALGGAMFDAPIRSSVASLSRPKEIDQSFARVGIARNLAQIIGPVIGAFLIQFSFSTVGYGAAIFFFLTLIAVWWGVPNQKVSNSPFYHNRGPALHQVFKDKPFIRFTLLCAGFWFLWVQLAIGLPLIAKEITGSTAGVGFFLAANSIFAVSVQIPAVRVCRKFLHPRQTLILGTTLSALGLGIVAWATTFPHLLAATCLYTLGVVLVTPNIQTVAAQMAGPAARGSYLGFNALALALGGGLGNLVGGWLIDLAAQLSRPSLPWLIYLVIGLFTAAGLLNFHLDRQKAVSKRSASPRDCGMIQQRFGWHRPTAKRAG